jgi:hypothetical protein
MPIQNRLNVSWEIQYFGHVRNGLDLVWGTSQSHEIGSDNVRRMRPHLVASDATGDFSRLKRDKTVHSFHREIILVQSDKKE